LCFSNFNNLNKCFEVISVFENSYLVFSIHLYFHFSLYPSVFLLNFGSNLQVVHWGRRKWFWLFLYYSDMR
jgi:hypothetical protein